MSKADHFLIALCLSSFFFLKQKDLKGEVCVLKDAVAKDDAFQKYCGMLDTSYPGYHVHAGQYSGAY